jgi:putative transposase
VLSSLATSLYIPTREGWLYLAVVIDLFSRAILGWKLSDSLHADLVVGATTRAIESGLVPQGAIFHSDRGCQYSATITRELLARHGLRQSMSAKGYCYDNAFSGPSGIFVGFFTGLMVAVRPQTLHRSPRQAFGGNIGGLACKVRQKVD